MDTNSQIKQFKEQIRKNPNDDYAYFKLGELYRSINDNTNTIASWKKAVELNRKEPSYHYVLGVAYLYLTNEYNLALNSFQQILILEPNYGSVYCLLSSVYQKIGKYDQAITTARKSLQVDQSQKDKTLAYEVIIYCLMRLNSNDELIKECLNLIANNFIINDLYTYLGNAYINKRQYEKAIESHRTATIFSPTGSNYCNLANAFTWVDKYEDAISNYELAIEIEPKLTESYRLLGDAYIYKEKWGKAIEIFIKGLKYKPDNLFVFYNGLGDCYFELKDYKTSLDNYRLSLNESDKQEETYIKMGKLFMETKQFDKAIEMYLSSLKIKDDNSETYLLLSDVYFELNNEDKAKEILKKGLLIKPIDEIQYNNLALAFETLGDLNSAIAYLNKAIEIDPDYAIAYNNLGYMYLEKKDYKNCLRACKLSINLNPKNPKPYRHMGNAYFALMDYDKALAAFNKAVNLKENYTIAYCNKGKLLKVMGMEKEALECFNKAHQIIQKGLGDENYTKNKKIIRETLDKDRVELLKQINELKNIEIESYMPKNVLENENIIRLSQFNRKKQSLLNRAFDQFDDGLEKKDSSSSAGMINEIQTLKKEFELFKIESDNKLKNSLSEIKTKMASKSEVSQAIKYNNYNEEVEKEMKTIYDCLKLHSYFKTFCSTFSQAYVAYMTISSGLVDAKKDSLSGLIKSIGVSVPVLGKVFSIFGKALEYYEEIKIKNKGKLFSSVAPNIITMEKMVEYAARKITLNPDKSKEILEATDKSHKIVQFFNKLKSKVIVDQYNTPEKMLAFKDSSILIMACVSERINSNNTPEQIQNDFISLICEKDSKNHFENVLYEKIILKDGKKCLII